MTPLRFAALITLVACAAPITEDAPSPKGREKGRTDGSDDVRAPSGGFGGEETPVETGGCKSEAKLVYVLSAAGEIHSFSPLEKKFTKVSSLACSFDTTERVPHSMAVDRNAVAWVNLKNPKTPSDCVLAKVDLASGKCTATPINGYFGGMGFASNDGAFGEETLFLGGFDTGDIGGIALMKVDGGKVAGVGENADAMNIELTGTGDGKLFGFSQTAPASLVRIDKKLGTFTDPVDLSALASADAFAFSFWGGDFYFYTQDASAGPSKVSRFRPSDGKLDVNYMPSTNIVIVGAGVSTCAPTSLPK